MLGDVLLGFGWHLLTERDAMAVIAPARAVYAFATEVPSFVEITKEGLTILHEDRIEEIHSPRASLTAQLWAFKDAYSAWQGHLHCAKHAA